VAWDYRTLPITIQVKRDVPIRPCGFERGVLCAQASLEVPEGERFTMVAIGQDGSCTIEYKGSHYEPSSCPWLEGFRDHQQETFVIVEVQGRGT
jgi:hypothetical protein